MAKFHINSNGDVKVCAAKVNRCQFGDDTLHFSTAVDARKTVEELLSKDLGENALRGAKVSLEALITKKAPTFFTSPTKPASKPATNSAARSTRTSFEEQTLALGFRKVEKYSVPFEIVGIFTQRRQPGDKDEGYYINRNGDYVKIVLGTDNYERRLTAPPTKDIALDMAHFETWGISLHSDGPKVAYLCGGCGRENKVRMRRFGRAINNSLEIRCDVCNQLNRALFKYNEPI